MEFVRRVARTINYKYLSIAVAIVVLFNILTMPAFIDPVIGFLLAGIIPGTDIVMAPETVLIILTDIFGVAVAALLIGWLVRRRLLSDDIDYAKAAKAAQIVDEAKVLIKATKRMHASAPIRKAQKKQSAKAVRPIKSPAVVRRVSAWAAQYPVLRLVVTSLATLYWLIAAGVLTVVVRLVAAAVAVFKAILFGIGIVLLTTHYLLALMLAGAAQIGKLLLGGIHLLLKNAVWALVFIIVVLGTIIDQAIRFAKFVGRKLQPHLRSFDSWLELQFRKLTRSLNRSYHRNEGLQVFVMVLKDTVAGVQRFFK